MYVFARKGKPVMYQRQDDGMFVIKGRGVECEGKTMRGAYTRWRNLVAFQEMSGQARAAFLTRVRRPPPIPGFLGLPRVG